VCDLPVVASGLWKRVASKILQEKMMRSIKGCLSKSALIVVLVTLVGALSSSATVQVTNITSGGSINFSNLVTSALYVQVGDKLFGNFSFQYLSTDTNASEKLVPADLALSALDNQVGFGISIQSAGFSAEGMDTKDIDLSFSVQVTGSPDLISGVDLSVNGGATGMGEAGVTENIYTHGIGAGNIANLFANIDASSATPEDSVTFSQPQAMIWVEKDLSVSGDPDGTACGNPASNYAIISIVDQTFAQVPEPSTWALLGAGLAGLLILRRRK
jgi:PEP-CTERM motif-containing protein